MNDHDPAEELLTEARVCTLLGIDSDALKDLVAEDRVLEIQFIGGNGFPAFQFEPDGTLLPGLREVIEELCVVDDHWLWSLWLLKALPGSDDGGLLARWEHLRAGNIEAVVCAASRSAWAWREGR